MDLDVTCKQYLLNLIVCVSNRHVWMDDYSYFRCNLHAFSSNDGMVLRGIYFACVSSLWVSVQLFFVILSVRNMCDYLLFLHYAIF